MKRDIPIAQLMPGDILLYRGTGWISDAIRLFDRSEVSHASLFLGRYGNKGRVVGEAVREGLLRRELSISVEHAEWVESRRLKQLPVSLDPVLEHAANYLEGGERYAYEQILLLVFLCITRRLAGSSVLGSLVRETLDSAAAFLLRLFDAGRQPMICSEFVYRCYGETLPNAIDVLARGPGLLRFGDRKIPIGKNGGIHRDSALWLFLEMQNGHLFEGGIDLAEAPRSVAGVDVSRVELRIEAYFQDLQSQTPTGARIELASPELRPSFERFAAALHRVRHPQEKGETSRVAVLGGLLEVAADFVTPGDLKRSKSLAFIGRLDKKGLAT